MPVAYRLLGYDRDTEELSCEYLVPDAAMADLRVIADAPASWPENAEPLPLTMEMASAIGRLLKCPLDGDDCDWVLEAVGS